MTQEWFTTREVAEMQGISTVEANRKLARLYSLGAVARRYDPANPVRWQWKPLPLRESLGTGTSVKLLAL